LKIAHFVGHTPKRSGLYETTRELCLGEVRLGHKAALIDTLWIGTENKPPTTFQFDRGVDVAPLEWAIDADVHVLHSQVPVQVKGKAPIVMVLHGLPEYVFYSQLFDHDKGDGGHSTLINYGNDPHVTKFVTFWPRHVEYWKAIFGDKKVTLCAPPVNLSEYSPEGNKYTLMNPGKFNVGYCDTWRPTVFKDPFQIIAGFRVFWRDNQDAKMQIFGIPSDGLRQKEWGGVWDKHILAVKKHGDFFGELHQLHQNMSEVYRALDCVITTSTDATRIVRETLASGVPLIAPIGCEFTKYTCQMDQPNEVALAISRVRADIASDKDGIKEECLNMSERFDMNKSVTEFVKILEDASRKT
jgi:glycosyltransferase involved in cell wall biosynthesis